MERSSERSDVPRPVSSHRFATGARDPSRDVVFEEYKRSCLWDVWAAFCAVQGGVGKRASTRVQSAASVSCAFSMPPVRSIGRPAPVGLAVRGTGSGLAVGVQAGVCDAYVVSDVRVFGARCVRRIERRFISMRCASWSRRSADGVGLGWSRR